jgi:hypothetical protein
LPASFVCLCPSWKKRSGKRPRLGQGFFERSLESRALGATA